MRLQRLIWLFFVGAVLAAPAPARADWILTPFAGANFGGDAPATTASYGATLGYMGAGAIGFDIDFGIAPNFFNDPNTTAFDSNVTSLMANLIVGAPIGGQHGPGVRPYVSGGAGLLRTRVDSVDNFFDATSNSFGLNGGGGVMAFFSDHVGVRGDIRYFRSLQDNNAGNGVDLGVGKFGFWRGTAGVSFRF